MKLSMNMLSWYLKEHNPICHFEDDDLTIEGLRFVLDDADHLQPEYLYFCNANTYFASRQYENAYMAVNRHSTMLFMNSDYNQLLNRILSAFDFFARLEGKLLDAASSHAPLRTFLAIMEPVLENPFMISSMLGGFRISTDYSGHKVDPVWAGNKKGNMDNHPGLYSPYYDHEGNRIIDLSESPMIVRNVYESGDPVIMLYLKKAGEKVATLSILQEFPELTTQNMQLAPVFTRYCVHAEEFTRASGPLRAGSAMFSNLLEGEEIGISNCNRLKELSPTPPWRLLVFRLVTRTDTLAKNALISHLRSLPELSFPTASNDACYALVADHVFQNKYNRNGFTFSMNEVCICASMPFSALSSLPIRKQQADFTYQQSPSDQGVYLCEQYACDYLIRTIQAQELTKSLLHPALEVLNRYDEENQTEMRKTLTVFLQQERNQLRSAKALHVHPNTLRYRIQRICEMTGLTLSDEAELKYLRLSDWLS